MVREGRNTLRYFAGKAALVHFFFLLPFLAGAGGSGICSLLKVVPTQLSQKFGVSSSSVQVPRQLELAAFEKSALFLLAQKYPELAALLFYLFDAQSPGEVFLLVLSGAGRNETLWGSEESIVGSPRPFALKNLFELGISWEATGRKVAVNKQKSKLAFNLSC